MGIGLSDMHGVLGPGSVAQRQDASKAKRCFRAVLKWLKNDQRKAAIGYFDKVREELHHEGLDRSARDPVG